MSAGFRAGQTNDGYFQINGTDILSVSSGVLGVKNTGAQSEVRLYCESNNAHYASLKSPPHSDFIGNVTFTLPGTAGNNGQVLQTDGSGNLSWVNNSGGGGGGGGGASDKLSEGNTEAEVIDTGSNGHFKVTTEGTERFRIDSGGRITVNDGSRLAGDANEGAQLRVTGTPLTRNQYYSPAGDYFGSFGYTDNTYTKSWIAVDSSYNKTSSVSSGIFLSAFHADAGGSACGHTIKNVRTDAGGLIFSSVATGSVNNPAVETERLRITSAGKMGIGTNNPQEQLVVSNSGAEGFEISAGIASNVNKIVNYNRSTSTYTSLRLDSAEYIFRIGASEKLRIGPSGQIGIGDPTNYGTSGQVLTSGGASGAVSWTTISGGGGASYGNSDVDNHLNTGGASSGQILSWNGSDYAWVADQGGSGGGGGISDVVDDTTPQLGGNLDLNSKNITGTGNITITGTLTSDGISVGNSSGSSDKITAGANDELQIYHDGTRSRIHDDATNATFFTTNALHIRDKADTEAIAKFTAGGAVELYHDNSKKLETTNTGVTVTGTLAATTLSGSLATTNLTGAITNAQLAGSIADSKLASTFLKNVVEDSSPQLSGNLDVQSNQINTSTSNGNIKLAPNGSGVVEIRGAGGSDGTLQLNCSAQSHGIKLKSPPHSAAASYTLTFPNSIVAGKFLTSDGSGNLSFSTELTGKLITTQSSSNIGLELHATGSGRGSQVKIHNDHGEAYVGTAGDTTGDFIVWQQSTANLLFGTSNIERLSIDSDGSAFFKGGSNGTKGTINIESNDPFIRIYDSDGTANRRKWDIRLIGQSGYEELDFRAVNDANSSFISKMQIEYGGDVNISDGNLRVADGHGIDFSANGNSGGMTSELLDDYEEGTWTPQWGSTSGSFGSITYAHQSGTYTKIGNRVFVDCRLRSNSLAMGTASSHLLVTGLPFTVANSQGAGGGSPSMYGLDLPDGTKNIAIETRQNSTQFYAGLVTRDNASWSNLQANALSTGISIIRVTFSYYTNS